MMVQLSNIVDSLRKLGIQTRKIDAVFVVIQTRGKDIDVNQPEVTEINENGKRVYLIVEGEKKKEAGV